MSEAEDQEIAQLMKAVVDCLCTFDDETADLVASFLGGLGQLADKHGGPVQPLLAWAICKLMDAASNEMGENVLAATMLAMRADMRKRKSTIATVIDGKVVLPVGDA